MLETFQISNEKSPNLKTTTFFPQIFQLALDLDIVYITSIFVCFKLLSVTHNIENYANFIFKIQKIKVMV